MRALTEHQAVLLSYLVGLAPVGQEVRYERRLVALDLKIENDGRIIHERIGRLIDVGAIEMIEKGKHQKPTIIRVLKRPEDFFIVESPSRSLVGYAGMVAA